MCAPPTPSSLYLFLPNNCGNTPPIDAPVESCRYLPTTLLEFPRPLGCRCDLELSISLADSHALAANIIVLPLTWYSCISSLFTYETAVAFPSLSVSTSRAIALVNRSTLPVFIAGFIKTDEDEKSAYTVHPRLHWLQ